VIRAGLEQTREAILATGRISAEEFEADLEGLDDPNVASMTLRESELCGGHRPDVSFAKPRLNFRQRRSHHRMVRVSPFRADSRFGESRRYQSKVTFEVEHPGLTGCVDASSLSVRWRLVSAPHRARPSLSAYHALYQQLGHHVYRLCVGCPHSQRYAGAT
jgi:hypothetical protein